MTRTAVQRLTDRISSVRQAPQWWRGYAWAGAAVVGATLAMLTVRDTLGTLNVLLIFLLVSFVLALTTDSGPAALAAILSFLAFNLVFIPPFYTLTVARSDHLLVLFVYLGVAFVTGQLVARVRTRTEQAVREGQRTALLYDLNAALIGGVTLDTMLATIVERVVRVYGAAQARILLPDAEAEQTLRVRARFPPDVSPAVDRQGLTMAAWSMEHREPAGQSTAGRRIRLPHGVAGAPRRPVERPGQDVLYLPIATAERVIGVLEVTGKPTGGRFDPEDETLLMSFANQAALALDRARLTEESAAAAALAQSDALKSALLAAVSHDLRTPLAAIKASATAMLDTSVEWTLEARQEFLHAIDEETDRLTLMVANLLDLSRIEGGALRPDREWYDVAELIDDVTHRLAAGTAQHRLTTAVAPDLPLVYFDYVEVAQVLTNLVGNAVKYTSLGRPIVISARATPEAVEIAVADRGPGIPANRLPHIFDKFYRADPSSNVPGTGIGLTISKGLIEAHGGRIWAESRAGEGTTIRFTLPLLGKAEAAARAEPVA